MSIPTIYSRTTAATVQPVSLADFRKFARVDAHEDDDLMASLLAAAIKYVEDVTYRQCCEATYTGYLNTFPGGNAYLYLAEQESLMRNCSIWLPRPPLRSVTSVKWRDSGGTQNTLASTNYTVDTTSDPGRIVLNYGVSWPPCRGHINDVEIIWKAGYGTTAASVPATIKQLILFVAAYWYEHRLPADAAGESELPLALNALIATERAHGVPC